MDATADFEETEPAPAWHAEALPALRAAYPAHGWRPLEASADDLGGYLRVGSVRYPLRLSRDDEDDGWFRAEVYATPHGEGMHPRDPVAALRVALRRAGVA